MKRMVKNWSRGASDNLVNFLKLHQEFPIVAHNVSYDLDDVLKPAFARVENLAKLPKA